MSRVRANRRILQQRSTAVRGVNLSYRTKSEYGRACSILHGSASTRSSRRVSGCNSWQFCSIVAYGLDLRPTSSAITGMREAAGGRQPAAAKPPCTLHKVRVNRITLPFPSRAGLLTLTRMAVLAPFFPPGIDRDKLRRLWDGEHLFLSPRCDHCCPSEALRTRRGRRVVVIRNTNHAYANENPYTCTIFPSPALTFAEIGSLPVRSSNLST